jgi:hypothetical protein
MSLLNDALKRASQTQQELDTVRISLPPPAAPVPGSQAGLGWALPVLIILLIVTAGAFVTLAIFARKAAPAPAPQITRAATVPPPARPVPAAPKPVAPPVTTQTPAVAASAPVPPPPPLKVQGITYSNAKWQAIVNGKTVFIGDSVNGFRIAAIYQNHVSFIAPDGSRKLVPFGE